MRDIVAPQKVGVGLEKNLAHIRDEHPHGVALTELDLGKRDYIPVVRKVFRPQFEVIAPDKGQHSREIAVVVKGKVLSNETIQISKDIGDAGVGNDRWVNRVKYKRWGRTYVWLHTHVDAVIQDHEPRSKDFGKMLDNARTLVTAKAMETIEGLAREALRDPKVFAIKISGDFNYLPVGKGTTIPQVQPWEFSPQEMFRRLGMQWVNSRVVYYAWSKNLRKRRVKQVPPHSRTNLSDHGRIVVDVLPRLHRRK